MPFPILDPVQPTPYEDLNDNQKKKIVDVYAEGGNETAIKHNKEIADLDHGHYVPTSTAKGALKKIKAITAYCEQLMQGLVIVTPAVIDPETGEIITPAVYNTKPETIAELKIEAKKGFPECSQVAFEYTIDVMVYNMTVEHTWEAYKAYFDNLPQ